MTHYLRDSDNKTLVDIEASSDDISCVVDVEIFAKHLLLMPTDDLTAEFIEDFSDIQEIRGYYFEVDQCKTSPDKIAKSHILNLCNKWGFCHVTD